MSLFNKNRRGILGTGIFHAGLAVLLIFLGFTTPLPLPEEEGILINFGMDDAGSGLTDPSLSVPEEEAVPPPETSQPENTPVTETEEEAVLTQDIEETVALPSGTEEEKKPTPEEIEAERKKQEKIEAERKRQAELEKQRILELEKKRLEEVERKRLEEEQRKIQEISDRTKNVFATGKNLAETDSGSQGVTGGAGNQGGITGDPSSKNYSGTGTGKKGISYSLDGRTPLSLPLPEYNYQKQGIVVVEVTVDRNGLVTIATPGVKGSTTLDENLLRAARKAALAAKFDRKPDAPAFQKGTITYHFSLQ